MRFQATICVVSGLVLSSGTQAALVPFDNESDLTGNFREANNPGNIQWQDGGYIENVVSGGGDLVYDTTPADPDSRDIVTDPIVSVDFRFRSGNSQLGLFFRIPEAEDNAWTVLISSHSSGTQDRLRLFAGGAIGGSGLGTHHSAAQATNSATDWLNNDGETWYTLVLTQTELGDGFNIDASVFERETGTEVSALQTYFVAETYSRHLPPGQVGLRVMQSTAVDNFQIVPEPASLGLLAMGGGALLLRRRGR